MTEKDYFSLIKKEQLNKAIEELKNNKFPSGFLNLINYESPLIYQFKYKETDSVNKNSSYKEWVYYIITYYGKGDYNFDYDLKEDIQSGFLLKTLLILQSKIKKAE